MSNPKQEIKNVVLPMLTQLSDGIAKVILAVFSVFNQDCANYLRRMNIQ